MADPRFFKTPVPHKLQELAEITHTRLADPGAGNLEITGVAPLSKAGSGDLSFLDNPKYREEFKSTCASACIVSGQAAGYAPGGLALLISDSPYKSYALAAQHLYPEYRPEPYISDHAVLGDGITLGEGCIIEAGSVLAGGVTLGRECWIESGAVIRDNVEIGDHCRIGASATVSHALIGDNVRLYPGVRIGQDGFGFALDPEGYVKVPQLGRVVIEDNVEIGANTTIDRGAGPDTRIGQGTWIDNLVQIGHNVQMGRQCVMVSQSGISGSTRLDDFVIIGGQVGISGHLHIGKGARIAAKSGVMRDIEPGGEVMGYPALPKGIFMRQIAFLNKIIRQRDRKGNNDE